LIAVVRFDSGFDYGINLLREAAVDGFDQAYRAAHDVFRQWTPPLGERAAQWLQPR
jgi:hypothetical protein